MTKKSSINYSDSGPGPGRTDHNGSETSDKKIVDDEAAMKMFYKF